MRDDVGFDVAFANVRDVEIAIAEAIREARLGAVVGADAKLPREARVAGFRLVVVIVARERKLGFDVSRIGPSIN
ncbi:MAG: hypothetical protein DCF16_08665 [Alphaproteobacteria bacterium]|nr:MAG: hypothetical protein DCF16_08665 [Alphaproteobacteria bacterium]